MNQTPLSKYFHSPCHPKKDPPSPPTNIGCKMDKAFQVRHKANWFSLTRSHNKLIIALLYVFVCVCVCVCVWDFWTVGLCWWGLCTFGKERLRKLSVVVEQARPTVTNTTKWVVIMYLIEKMSFAYKKHHLLLVLARDLRFLKSFLMTV